MDTGDGSRVCSFFMRACPLQQEPGQVEEFSKRYEGLHTTSGCDGAFIHCFHAQIAGILEKEIRYRCQGRLVAGWNGVQVLLSLYKLRRKNSSVIN